MCPGRRPVGRMTFAVQELPLGVSLSIVGEQTPATHTHTHSKAPV